MFPMNVSPMFFSFSQSAISPVCETRLRRRRLRVPFPTKSRFYKLRQGRVDPRALLCAAKRRKSMGSAKLPPPLRALKFHC